MPTNHLAGTWGQAFWDGEESRLEGRNIMMAKIPFAIFALRSAAT